MIVMAQMWHSAIAAVDKVAAHPLALKPWEFGEFLISRVAEEMRLAMYDF
jgi:hypothetical protein